jgi:hypothetical protein
VDFGAAQSSNNPTAAILGEDSDDVKQERRHCQAGAQKTHLTSAKHSSHFFSLHQHIFYNSQPHQFTFKPTQNPPNHFTSITMSGTGNVGNSGVYEAGDQRTYTDSEIAEQKQEARFHEGKEHSHKANDSSKKNHSSTLFGHIH